MDGASLSELLTLPPRARADLAMALWASLSDQEREAALSPDPDFLRELDRRWEDHIADPSTAVSWNALQRKLRG